MGKNKDKSTLKHRRGHSNEPMINAEDCTQRPASLPTTDPDNSPVVKPMKPQQKRQRYGELFCSSELNGIAKLIDRIPEWPWMPVMLLGIALVTRFWRLYEPPAVVFDEHHFGRFTNQYHMGTYFFDIHPPLGKWGFMIAAWLTGYEYEYCDYTTLGVQYDLERCKFMPLRRIAALFGAVTVPFVYSCTRLLGGGKWAALFSACLFNWDMLNLIESRLILTDSQLMWWMVFCLHVGLCYFRRIREHWAAKAKKKDDDTISKEPSFQQWRWYKPASEARLLSFKERLGWSIGLGLACGAAVSVKWTGLATPGLIAIECWMGAFFLPDSIDLWDMLIMLVSALFLYTTNFFIHFKLLPSTGDGDAFMSMEFQRTLKNNTHYDPGAPKVPFLTAFWQLNKEMLYGNARIDVPHNWESKWHTWPINQRGVLYYSNTTDSTLGYTESVYLIGNPAVLWMVLGLLCCAGLYVFLYFRYRNVRLIKSLFFNDESSIQSYMQSAKYCFAAYCVNLIPYIPVTRSCFLYHYMPALLYAEILAGLTLERIMGRYTPHAVQLLLAFVLVVFAFFAPWVYSLPLTAEGHERRRWFSTWN